MSKALLVLLLSWNVHAVDGPDPAGISPADPGSVSDPTTSDIEQAQAPHPAVDPATGFGAVESGMPLLAGKAGNGKAEKVGFLRRGGWARVGRACLALIRRGVLTVEDCDPERVHVARSNKTGVRVLVLETKNGKPYFFTLRGRRLPEPDTRFWLARSARGLREDVLTLTDGRKIGVVWHKKLRAPVWYFEGAKRAFSKADYVDLNHFISWTGGSALCAEGLEDWSWPALK